MFTPNVFPTNKIGCFFPVQTKNFFAKFQSKQRLLSEASRVEKIETPLPQNEGFANFKK